MGAVVAITETRSERTTWPLVSRLQGPGVVLMLALWSAAIGDLLYWVDLYPSDLIFHPFHSLRAIFRGIFDDAGTMLLYLSFGASVVVPLWLLWQFIVRHRERQNQSL